MTVSSPNSELLGVAEVAELLGVTRQAVTNWKSRGNFPDPIANLKSGPVWGSSDVLDWAQAMGIEIVERSKGKSAAETVKHRVGACIVSVVNAKGGVGKSTICVNLGWFCYAYLNKRVLLIDLDPQFNLSQYALGGDAYETLIRDKRPTVTSIFSQGIGPARKRSIGKQAISSIRKLNVRGGQLDVIPSDINLAWNVREPYHKNDSLKNYIKHVVGYDAYDLVLIDCPPTDSVLTDAAYAASDFLLVPVRPEFLSAVGLPLIDSSLQRFHQLVPESELEVAGVVINGAVESKPEYKRSKADILKAAKAFGWHVFDHELGHSESYPKGARLGASIFHTVYARWGRRREFAAFAQEFAKRVNL
jgi:chromosome partitioning protein